MQKKDIYALIFLIILTIITAVFSVNFNQFKFVVIIILVLSSIKFLIVSFQFMELKKANTFWKILISSFLIIFIGIISILL